MLLFPAYNEAITIASVLQNLKSHLDEKADILVIDDGSRDDTANEARKSDVQVCALPCNLGYAKALKTGLKWGLHHHYDWFAFMDADGQHRPEDMTRLISDMETQNVDLIIGSRWTETGVPDPSTAPGRRMGMIFFSWLTRKLTGPTANRYNKWHENHEPKCRQRTPFTKFRRFPFRNHHLSPRSRL